MESIKLVDQHMIINSCKKDVEVFCAALVSYKVTKIYEIYDPSADYKNLEKKLNIRRFRA